MKESDLLMPLLTFLERSGYVTETEFRTPLAIPDIIAVKPNRRRVQQRVLSGQLTPLTRELYWSLLAQIPDSDDGKSIAIHDLADHFGLSPTYLKNQVLRRLAAEGFVLLEGEYCQKIDGFHPFADEVLSIEAKLSKWRSAGEQALRHKTFVNRAYVALPSKYIERATSSILMFETANVGLFEVRADGSVLERFSPTWQPATYGELYQCTLERLWPRVFELMGNQTG